jgi:hypothetical protein
MRLGARVRAVLLEQAHSTRLDARPSAMLLSKGLSRRLGFFVSSVIPLGQPVRDRLFSGVSSLVSLSPCLVSLLSAVLVLVCWHPAGLVACQPSWCSYRCVVPADVLSSC